MAPSQAQAAPSPRDVIQHYPPQLPTRGAQLARPVYWQAATFAPGNSTKSTAWGGISLVLPLGTASGLSGGRWLLLSSARVLPLSIMVRLCSAGAVSR